eukprot:5927970-Amphidinium_carterae.1
MLVKGSLANWLEQNLPQECCSMQQPSEVAILKQLRTKAAPAAPPRQHDALYEYSANNQEGENVGIRK